MKKENWFYIISEQILLSVMLIIFYKKFPERFSSGILVVILPLCFGIMLSRLIFLLAEKYEQKYGSLKVKICRLILITGVIGLTMFTISRFEPVNLRTFIFLILSFVFYLYLTKFFSVDFITLIEQIDPEPVFEEEDPPTAEDYSEIIDVIALRLKALLLQELKALEKRSIKLSGRYYDEFDRAEVEMEKRMIRRLVVYYIDVCAGDIKNTIPSEQFKNTEKTDETEQQTTN